MKIGRGAWLTRDHGKKRSFPPVFKKKNWLNFCVWGQFEIKIVIVLGDSDINTHIWYEFKKVWACDHLKTSKLTADYFKKILDLNGSTPEPAIRSGETDLTDPTHGIPHPTAVLDQLIYEEPRRIGNILECWLVNLKCNLTLYILGRNFTLWRTMFIENVYNRPRTCNIYIKNVFKTLHR